MPDQCGVLPLDEYQRRRQAVEQQMGALDRQAQQIASQVEQQQEWAGVMVSIEAFCQRVQAGLENATFAQKRQLVEVLIDRVIVTNGDVEIRYVIPTSPSSEHIRFSHLRTTYLPLFSFLEARWHLGTSAHALARTGTPSHQTRNQPQCRHLGQSVGQDDGKRGLRGYDGGKKVKGSKRHLLVDTQGFLLQPVVHTADMADRDGGKLVLRRREPVQERFPRLKHLWLDTAYQGKFEDWVKATFGWSVEVVKHWWTGVRYVWVAPGQEPPTLPSGFHVLPHRWIVERTFGWLGRHRRLSKDYEYLPETSETWISIAMSRLVVKRLAGEEVEPPFHYRSSA